MRRAGIILILPAAVGVIVLLTGLWLGGRRVGGAMPQEAYVWQRAWTDAVKEAVREHGRRFSRLVVLGAEVSWGPDRPQVARAGIDYETLRRTGRPVGVALRVGPYRGRFADDDAPAGLLANVAAGLVRDARTGGVQPAELQIDFDCAESRLSGYRLWVRAVKARIAPVPVTVTALPCWLERRAFKALAAEADGFVLQVHSLKPPPGPEEAMTLCDPAAAREAVERAARLNRPFRVALPTYGYVAAFGPGGKFLGLSAEGPSMRWPEGARLRAVRADPARMAALVRGWTLTRPEPLRGICWYRLPTREDTLNWRWPTLAAVMAGRAPRPDLRAEARRPQPGLIEIDLRNAGSGEASLAVVVIVRFPGGKLIARDAVGGFECVEAGPAELRFRPVGGAGLAPLGPGERKVIGWLRLGSDREVQIDVSPLDS